MDEARRIEEAGGFEARLEASGHLAGMVGDGGDLRQRERPTGVRAEGVGASSELDLLGRGAENRGCDVRGLGRYPVRRERGGLCAHRDRA
jgi:hypothetical protein